MTKRLLYLVLLGVLGLAACSRAGAVRTDLDGSALTAMVRIQPLDGSSVRGIITFTEAGEDVAVRGTVRGLDPGAHGFHIHGGVTCEAPGDHYNPNGDPHGAPDDAERHRGDLGNLEAGADSTASIDRTDHVISLTGEQNIVGHAVIVHQGEDDYATQPSGDSGPEVGCGIIELP